MARCGLYAVGDGGPAVIEVSDAADGTRRAWWRRVKLCQRPGCPVCSVRKAAKNRALADAALRGAGGTWTMGTWTVQHSEHETAREVLDRLMAAFRRWRSSRAVRAIYDRHVSATIRTIELTRGRHGWHWHVHVLMRTDPREWDPWDRATWEESWCRISGAARGVGFCWSEPYDGGDERARRRAIGYVAKAGCEVAGIGKSGSRRSVWRILERATRGDLRSRELWRELDGALHGRRLFELDERAKRWADEAPDTACAEVRRWTISVEPDLYRALGVLESRSAELPPAERREAEAATWGPLELGGAVAGELDPTPAIEAWIVDRARRAVTLGWIWSPDGSRDPPLRGPLAAAPSMAALAAAAE